MSASSATTVWLLRSWDDVWHASSAYRHAFGPSHGVEVADALIAASAHIHGLTLCSRNLRHYPMRDVKKQRL